MSWGGYYIYFPSYVENQNSQTFLLNDSEFILLLCLLLNKWFPQVIYNHIIIINNYKITKTLSIFTFDSI